MQVTIIKFIQSFQHPVLDRAFESITLLGEETFILLFFTILYWTIDKKLARDIGLALFISVALNSMIKAVLMVPRPIGLPGIRSLRTVTATGYAFPSGHTQSFATLGIATALWVKKRPFTALFTLLIILVGLSRLYLGVHWPTDVLGGMVLALLVSTVTYLSIRGGKAHWLLGATLLAGLPLLFTLQDDAYAKTYGLLVGFAIGLILETRHIDFSTRIPLRRKLLRIAIGLAGLVAIRAGLKPVLPDHLLSDALRYALMGCFGMALYPWFFSRYDL